MSFSKTSWQKIEPIFTKIIQSPFNQELASGKLATEKFAYYIEQDSIFLHRFVRVLARIAAQLEDSQDILNFLDFAKVAMITEQDLFHEHSRQTFPYQNNGLISSACIGYTSFLDATTANSAVEVSIAAVVPCFWLYNLVGNELAKTVTANNPYAKWIETYTTTQFESGVTAILAIANQYYRAASENIRQKMLQSSYLSSVWEYHFWQDSYNLNNFCPITAN